MYSVVPLYMGKVKNCIYNCGFHQCDFWYRKEGYCGKYFCHDCRGLLKKGDKVVRLHFLMTQKVSDKGAVEKGIKPKTGFIMFHANCFLEQERIWIENWFDKHPRSKNLRGRPKKYEDGKLVNQLRSLKRYHEQVGNLEAVAELDRKLEVLNAN